MTKPFFDVFRGIELEPDKEALFQDAEVIKVSANRDKSHIRIYLHANHLIPKDEIRKLEKKLFPVLFPNRDGKVTIIEKFTLSSIYTPRHLFDEYWESMLFELNEYSALEYNLLRTSDLEFTDDNHLTLTMEANIVGTSKGNEIVEFLEKIVCERCGMDFFIKAEYKDPKESKYRKNAKLQIEEEVLQIMKNTQSGKQILGIASENTSEGAPANESAELKNADSASKQPKAATAKKDFAAGKTFQKNGNQFANKGEFRRRYERGSEPSDNPDVLYGRDFEDEFLPIVQIDAPIGEVAVNGKVLGVETRDIRNERTIVSATITDFTDTMKFKMFIKTEEVKEFVPKIDKGTFIKVKGVVSLDKFDNDLTISNIIGIKKSSDFTVSRMDTAVEKRVELHCHTKMSDMDGVSDVKDIIKQAKKWGHKAIAITDHGDVQGFPDANHAVSPDDDFKVIYGVEAYLVDDLKKIVTGVENKEDDHSLEDTFVVFDIETTGFIPWKNKIIEIGAVKVENGKIVDHFSKFVNPQVPIPFRIETLTSIRDDMVMNEPTIDVILPEFMEFCKGAIMVAHNADFDMSFIYKNCESLGIDYRIPYVDTVSLARLLLPQITNYKLDAVAKAVNVKLEHHHRAVDDAECTALIFVEFIKMLEARGIHTLLEINDEMASSIDNILKMPSHHAIILATCDQGRTNLYRLVSESHIKYYKRRPRIPKSLFLENRDGLLIGSACEAGELYQAILNGRPEEEITRLVEFYDYLEIQPLGNNEFMLRPKKDGEEALLSSKEELIDINKRIVKLGEEFHKPVVATCDVHFLNPEDEIYRRIIMAGQGFPDADLQAPLYLHTTEEMLQEFSYLGSAKAEEVVITNPNKIADMCERIEPVRPDKCPPFIENSDQMLRDICYRKAHSMYGEELPKIVEERLERELNSIIGNGYAVMYIIAQKLVWKSNEDGYLVGSRGSVGSSFAATMAGITEVNPLKPHYLCPNPECKYSDFDSELVMSYAGHSGCDMVDCNCPKCGTKMKKEGFDIPFETFLGFKGNKEPDIDLNFSNEYQSKAHKYTEVIFGEGQTFKAGTVGTLADKTAFGFVKKYYEERGQQKRTCEIERIVEGCVGVHRTTGQHPGGIIVLPMGEEINTFTPIQHPANDTETDIITTHFDYHSIDHNLLKLDILGHLDPTMIRMLQDLTGVDPVEIPLDDPSVMSLFQNTEALGITPEDIGGTKLGCLGIPEFGTDFAMGMLIDTHPTEFSDLIRIAGLSHGTDVWLGNAQKLISEGTCTISTAICTRDDIMTYLISMGLDSEQSFKIMEAVRKGTVAKGKCGNWEEWKADMSAHGVPDWYIWSCEQIQYMFPKAHAAAYVMMAWRVAYCKVFYPLAYYAAFYSIRAKGFSYEIMCFGKEKLERYIEDYKRRKDELSGKEQETFSDMRLVQEMYARGYEFMPIDIYRSHPNRFQIVDGKLLPSLSSIDGLGDAAAVAISEAAKDGPFLSKDDFKDRTKVSKTLADLLGDLGLLGDIPESNQISLFDFNF